MNAKEELVDKISKLTIDKKITWVSKNIDDFKNYFTSKKNIKRILVSEYKNKTFLVLEEIQKNETLNNIYIITSIDTEQFDYSVYSLYIIENKALQVSISEEEISKEIFNNFISEVVNKFSERYLSRLINEI